ncbi:ligand-binding sensor domain-containing protein [Marinicella meishanensis]|uniref:ligand-binding sensor domain-containing protein n=1 Tax=Marinicella meishanensis TaxID=2873263 RepID=UPI001CC1BE83|nr:ligand-binding sensor domain-containing diguanylate cyclase [Marinicella sp. NBU2979]
MKVFVTTNQKSAATVCVWLPMIALLSLLGLLVGPVHAINDEQWQVEHIQIEDGLPDSTIYSVVQDQSGFIWLGTTSGLARYDGYAFKSLKHDGADPNTISNNNAGNIFVDSKNRLWVGTFGGGANLMDLETGELRRFPYSSSQFQTMVSENVQTFHEDPLGQVWIGTATGLYRFDEQNIKFYASGLTASGDEPYRVWDIVGDEQRLWLGTSDGLYEVNPINGGFKHHQLPLNLQIDITSNQFRTLHLKGDALWIGSSSGLYRFDLRTAEFSFHEATGNNLKINDLYETDQGDLLVASMEGLYLFDLANDQFMQREAGQLWQAMGHVDVRNINVDHSGIMWLATRDNGLFKIDLAGGLFKHHPNYLADEWLTEKAKQVWSIEYDADGLIYFGTSETVFRRHLDGTYDRITTAEGDPIDGFIRDIETTAAEGLWIAGSTGLYFLNRDSSVAAAVTTPFDLVGIDPADIFSIEIDDDGEMWLALYNLGILRWNRAANTAELMQSYAAGSLIDVNITHIKKDRLNNLWISSNLVGLFRFDKAVNQLTLYRHDYNDKTSIASNRIKDVVEDSSGRLWIATPMGLSQYHHDRNEFTNYAKTEGLINNRINFIIEDSQQTLWLGNKFGLTKFNPERQEFKNYLLNTAIRHDGMITRSTTIDDRDVIWLGSANGYYTFNPDDNQDNSEFVPPLILTEVRVDNRPWRPGKLLFEESAFTLNPENQVISFDIAVLDYKAPEQIQYLYRLEGLHDNWLDVSNTRRIDLKDLTPGAYQLDIMAHNNDGRWEEQSLRFQIKVLPVWWERTWVRALAVILFLLLAILLHNYRTFKIKRQNLMLEQEVSNRTLELQNLNEQLEMAANSDYLTGLPNRMAFINAYEELLKQRDANPFGGCIVMGDVDHFKSINDRFGHNAGDEVLVQVSQLVQQSLREEDLIARWGGEEFIFYFADKDATATANLIERIRDTVENSVLDYQGEGIQVTMTFGISQRQAGMSLIDCINAADEAMYAGKRSGRNQVVVA